MLYPIELLGLVELILTRSQASVKQSSSQEKRHLPYNYAPDRSLGYVGARRPTFLARDVAA